MRGFSFEISCEKNEIPLSALMCEGFLQESKKPLIKGALRFSAFLLSAQDLSAHGFHIFL